MKIYVGHFILYSVSFLLFMVTHTPRASTLLVTGVVQFQNILLNIDTARLKTRYCNTK
jgi:hypothetical protein